MWPSVRKTLHGIIWPKFWLQGGDVLVHNRTIVSSHPSVMLKMRSIFCNDVLNNGLLLLTFGLCSPVLALAIVCSILLKMSLWVLLIGRFTRCMLHDEHGEGNSSDAATTTTTTTATAPSQQTATMPRSSSISIAHENRNNAVQFALTALAEVYIPLNEVLAGSFWRLAWCSALFVAMLGWDMATDEVGWLRSVWVPLVPLVYKLGLRCVSHWYNCARNSNQDSAEKEAASLREGSVVSQSPLHEDNL
jgi:hypothetical protein